MYYLTEHGPTAYLPASWTDAGPPDPFVAQALGRAIARPEDLLELVRMAAGCKDNYAACVKGNKP